MLAESIVASIAYTDDIHQSHKCHVLKSVGRQAWPKQLTGPNSNIRTKFETPGAAKIRETCDVAPDEEVGLGSSAQNPPMKASGDRSWSAPVCIARRELHCEEELDLYRSWSDQSLYQRYPDLYIAGDHVADHTCDSGCIMDQTYEEMANGPILFSEDIPLGQSPPVEPLQKCKPARLWTGEDAGERSIILHRQPLSNSVINSYMEKKVRELYKQFLDEKLTKCSSISHVLMSHLLSHMGEVSHQLPRGQQAEAPNARKTLGHSLAFLGWQGASNGNSCECSTPNLQISATS